MFVKYAQGENKNNVYQRPAQNHRETLSIINTAEPDA